MQNMSALDAAYAEAGVAGVVNTQFAARERLKAFGKKSAALMRPKSWLPPVPRAAFCHGSGDDSSDCMT